MLLSGKIELALINFTRSELVCSNFLVVLAFRADIRSYQDRIIEHRLDKTDPLNFCRLSEFSSGDTILPMTLRYLHQQDQKERLDTFFTSNEILPT